MPEENITSRDHEGKATALIIIPEKDSRVAWISNREKPVILVSLQDVFYIT